MKDKIIALVPMKEHSARVPNKNIRKFCGKPLFCRIFNILLSIKYIEQIFVDTDSIKIKELIKKYYDCILIFDRPDRLCGDYVSMNKIIENDISKIKKRYFLQTHTTNPLIKPDTIKLAIEKYFLLLDEGYDSLFSVTKIQSRLYDKDANPINHNPDNLIRTQDLSLLYEENSNFYIFSQDSFKKKNSRIGIKPYLYEINKLEAIDIDTEEDFKLAEIICRSQNKVIYG